MDARLLYGQNVTAEGILGVDVASESRPLVRPSTFSIWPNPARETLTLRLDNADTYSYPVQVELLNTSGTLIARVYRGNLQPGCNEIEWTRPSGIQNGFYILKATAGGTTRYAKVILQ